jgi:fructoselysine-6-P-deglycase FrlB-like protein/sugar/nucleoside kinase (ribokinase family)
VSGAAPREVDEEQGGAGVPALPRVVVVGNLTIDDVVRPDGVTTMGALGGNTLYAALGARLWEPSVGIVTRRGEDFPSDGLAALGTLGVATDGVVEIAGPTVRNWVVYEDDGRRHWLYRTPPERSLEVAVRPEDLPEAWLATDGVVVHVAAMPLDAAETIVERVRRDAPGARITLDTHEDWGPDARDRVLALAARVHAFIPSAEEVAGLFGDGLAGAEALPRIASLPTPIVVVKLGAEGCLVRADRRTWRVGISPVGVRDVTGAGDAFCGGLAAGLAAGLDAVEAARRGAVSAAFAVSRFGSTSLAEVDPAEAERRLAERPPPVDELPSAVTETVADAVAPDERSIDVMRREIDTIPEVIATQLERLGSTLAELGASFEAEGIDEVVCTGCGDSWFAARAVTLALQRVAGVRASAPHAMELARYGIRYLRPKSAVICISYSGEVGRTIEAAAQARRFGHRVVALTGRADGRLAVEADRSVLLDVPTLGFSPGTSTYIAMVAALLELAAAWGEARAAPGAPDARASLRGAATAAERTIAASLGPAGDVAGALRGHPWVQFVGAGPHEAAARFGAAKMFEGPQILGVATNLEEWAHEEYFVTEPGSPVVVVAPTGASSDRAREICDELRFVGADTTVVTDARAPDDTRVLPIASGLSEEHTALLTPLPLALVAFHLATSAGKRSYNFPSAEAEREHYETIHRGTRGEPA